MLDRFGISPATLLGSGGESEVYALDDARVLRVYRSSGAGAYAERRREFYAWLDDQRLPFELPTVLEIGQLEGRIFAVERRMRGRVLTHALPHLEGADRERALTSYLGAAEAIGGIALPDRPFGEIAVVDRPLRRGSWSGFLWDRLMQSYNVSRPDVKADVPEVDDILAYLHAEVQALEPFSTKRLVHGDYFPGNAYVDDDLSICGVGDFGYSTVVGDPLMDVAGAIAFVEVVDGYRPEDSALLDRLALAAYGDEVCRWLRLYRLYYSFYFSGCKADDPRTYDWCVQCLRAWRDVG